MTRLALALAFTLFAPIARAGEPTAAAILKMADKAASDFKDLTTDTKMIVKEGGATAGREYRFRTITRGDKRLVRFLEPGDVKGMGMLIEGRDTMYAYLPGFNRVRRLGTHMTHQSFMGSDASPEDMAASNLADVYDAKLVGSEGNEWVIALSLKPGKEGEFPTRKIWVDKTIHQITRIEDYDDKGVNVRSQTRTDWKKDEGTGDHYTPFTMKIVDHRRNDHTTEMYMLSAKANQNVPDDMFSERQLVRGN